MIAGSRRVELQTPSPSWGTDSNWTTDCENNTGNDDVVVFPGIATPDSTAEAIPLSPYSDDGDLQELIRASPSGALVYRPPNSVRRGYEERQIRAKIFLERKRAAQRKRSDREQLSTRNQTQAIVMYHSTDEDDRTDENAEDQKQPAEVNNGLLQLSQMLGSFLAAVFPQAKPKADRSLLHSHLLILPDLSLDSSTTLRMALSTLCLGYIGNQTSDKQLIEQSRRSYSRTLKALVREMQGRIDKIDISALLASIMILPLYDTVLPDPKSATEDWQAHYDGAMALMRARGPGAIDRCRAFDNLALKNLRQPAVMCALARRRMPVLTEEEWSVFRSSYSKLPQDFVQGPPRMPALRVAQVVYETEKACSQPISRAEVLRLWERIQNARASMLDLIEREYSDLVYRAQSSLQHVTDLEGFNMEAEEHCFITTNSTFTSFWKWSENLKEQVAIAITWQVSMYMLIADCTALRLLHFHPWLNTHPKLSPLTPAYTIPKPQDVASNSPQHTLSLAAIHSARRICLSAYTQSKWDYQGSAAFLLTLTTLCQNVYEELGCVRELGWCQGLATATRLRLKRLRTFQPRTLCRMEDLHEGLSGLGKFRMRGKGGSNAVGRGVWGSFGPDGSFGGGSRLVDGEAGMGRGRIGDEDLANLRNTAGVGGVLTGEVRVMDQW